MVQPSHNLPPKRWFPAITWMAVIFAFSQHSNIPTGSSHDFEFKKFCHTGEFGVLALLFYFALTRPVRTWIRRSAEKAWAWSVLFAVSDEWHQHFIPTRSAQPRDVVIDSVGAFLGLWICFLLSRPPEETAEPRPEPPPLPPPVEFPDPIEAPVPEAPPVSMAPRRKNAPAQRRTSPTRPRPKAPKRKKAASRPVRETRTVKVRRKPRRRKRNPQMRLELRPSKIRKLRK